MGKKRMSSLYRKIKLALLRTRAQVGDGAHVKRYQPEKHYMRGPGPKTLEKLSDRPRADGS